MCERSQNFTHGSAEPEVVTSMREISSNGHDSWILLDSLSTSRGGVLFLASKSHTSLQPVGSLMVAPVLPGESRDVLTVMLFFCGVCISRQTRQPK